MTPHPAIPPKTRESLRGWISQFPKRRILIIGDLILDRYIWGEVERISPEAPVPVVRMNNEELRLGGAANVATNLAALGAVADLTGVAGRDEEARMLRETLIRNGIAPGGVVASAGRPTTVKTRVLSMGQQLLRLDKEETAAPDDETLGRMLARIEKELARCEVVILSDYDKGVLASTVCPRIIELARTAGKPVVVDPKGLNYRKYAGAAVVKPNQKEAEAAAGCRIRCDATLAEAAGRVQKMARAQAVVITRGGSGVDVFERRRKPVHFPALAHSVYDVTGAGDTFISVMALAMAAGAGVAEAAQLGNLAGSVVVGKLGAATVSAEELLELLED